MYRFTKHNVHRRLLNPVYLGGWLIIGNSALGALPMFSIMHIYYAVKYDVGSCNLGMSVTESHWNVGGFTLPGDWLPLMEWSYFKTSILFMYNNKNNSKSVGCRALKVTVIFCHIWMINVHFCGSYSDALMRLEDEVHLLTACVTGIYSHFLVAFLTADCMACCMGAHAIWGVFSWQVLSLIKIAYDYWCVQCH